MPGTSLYVFFASSISIIKFGKAIPPIHVSAVAIFRACEEVINNHCYYLTSLFHVHEFGLFPVGCEVSSKLAGYTKCMSSSLITPSPSSLHTRYSPSKNAFAFLLAPIIGAEKSRHSHIPIAGPDLREQNSLPSIPQHTDFESSSQRYPHSHLEIGDAFKMQSFEIPDHGTIEGMSDTAAFAPPGSELYEKHIKRWSKAAEKPASFILLPGCAEDVSKSILFCNKHGLDFAVCGGGHATSGSSSSNGGVSIDLSRMNRVTVDAEGKTVTAQGGALWRDVDAEAEKYGLAAVGGTVNHTGVGGLSLGGGYGYLTPAHGLVIDNILAVEYVLSDGQIITASEKENADLFWAARGAGTCFGVATSFTYRAHEQKDPVWAALLRFENDQLPAVIDFGNRFLEIGDERTLLLVAFAKVPDFGDIPSIVAVCFYKGQEAMGKSFYDDLFHLNPTVLKMGAIPYSAMNAYQNDIVHHGLRRSMKGSAFMVPLSLGRIKAIQEEFIEFVSDQKDADMSAALIEYYPFKNLIRIPQTATAFANRGAYSNLVFIITWTKEELDDICRGKARRWTSMVQEEFQKVKSAMVSAGEVDSVTKDGIGEYMNYDGFGSDGDKMFGVNYPRLRELKLRYDPKNLFNRVQS